MNKINKLLGNVFSGGFMEGRTFVCKFPILHFTTRFRANKKEQKIKT